MWAWEETTPLTPIEIKKSPLQPNIPQNIIFSSSFNPILPKSPQPNGLLGFCLEWVSNDS